MSWRKSKGGNKPNFKKGFINKQRSDRKPDRFSLLTKTPKEIFALEKGKFKAPPPMVTPAEKRDLNKYCEFHADTGHSTDECMQLRRQIEEMIKSGKLSQFIKELKQNDKLKAPKKGEMAEKDKPLTILMVQTWERVSKQRVTQSFSPETVISIPPLEEEDGTKGPMIIEAEIGGHFRHRIYVDRGASSEVTIPTQCNNRQDGYKKDPCLTVHGTRNVKILSRRRNSDVTKQQSRPDGIQKKRGQAPERNKAIQEEVEKLVDVGIMKEVHYHSWLSNPVMVKKHDGSWRMCVDFKDLNKACTKDGYPLPKIDWKVESLCGYPFKCFLDEGMFLGYKINNDDLKVCPDKEDTVLSLPSLGCLKDVQKLNGKLASLNRFLSKSEAEVAFRQMKKLITELHRTKRKRGANHVLSRKQGTYQCSLNDRKGGQANASVLCEPLLTRVGDQLHPHGKTGVSLAQRKQTAKKILPGTHNCCNHRSADKATTVKLKNHRKDAKVEI
ncbi:hypothetical protein Tco_1390445 [Tanacetum coccineum]